MKTEQSIYSEPFGWMHKSDNNLGETAQLIFLFGNRELLKKQEHIDWVRNIYPNGQIVGCSTSGEIFQEVVMNDNIVCTAVWFENTPIEIAREHIDSMEGSFMVGEKLAEKLDREDLIHIMILSEGLNINGSELTKGLNSKLNDRIPVTGGLAGDQADFNETVIIHNRAAEKNLVLAIGFYGQNLQVGYGSMGGWDSFGVDREVTRSSGNILYELDGHPALELYKRYLGDHAANLPASAMLFPLSLNGYIGSKLTPNYRSDDVYVTETLALRSEYQLDPAMILKDQTGNITGSQGLDDLINEIKIKGGNTENLDKLFDSGVYSYNPHIDWDKLINYRQYYWSTVTNAIVVSTLTNFSNITGHPQGTVTIGTSTNAIPLSNGMVVEQNGVNYFVEGVGTAIKLIKTDLLETGIDTTPEYVTINRASQDLNPWTRHNRWVHHDVIAATAVANGTDPTYPIAYRAKRPIVEFDADIQLYNFGSTAIPPVTVFDTTITNAFLSIEGSTSTSVSSIISVDGVQLQDGYRYLRRYYQECN